jgi:putative SOS response-associated peptidase YedK
MHTKAMPVIPRAPEEYDTWMSAPWVEAAKTQPLPDSSLRFRHMVPSRTRQPKRRS